MNEMGKDIDFGVDALPVLFDESGEEIQVGWYRYANGMKKPVYKKTITTTGLISTMTFVNHGILNIDFAIVTGEAFVAEIAGGAGAWITLPNSDVYCDISPTQIRYNGSSDYVFSTARVVFTALYTKTTDTPQ